jgi:hypothetical protein
MLVNEKIVMCSAIGNEARGKHKHYDSRGSVSAEKLPVIFSEEMRTSSGKYWEMYILGLAAPGICGNGLQIYIGVNSVEAMDFCERQPKNMY